MKVYLMQHGEAYRNDEDPLRPLNPAGVAQVKTAGKALKTLSIGFDLIVASPERRAQQTASLIAEATRYPYSDILTSEVLLPLSEPAEACHLLEAERDVACVLMVGHLPHLECLVRELTGGTLFFENAGLTCLELTGEEGVVRSLLTRMHLARIAGDTR